MNDPDLRDILRTELRDDEDRAPNFEAVWSAAAGRQHRARMRSVFAQIGALAAVVAFAFLATHAVRLARNPRAIVTTDLPWRSAVLLTEWRTPTDSLLPAAAPFPLQP